VGIDFCEDRCYFRLSHSQSDCLVTVDGAMLASRDFGFMLGQGIFTMLLQIFLLRTWASSITDIFTTFTLRLGLYALTASIRAGLGFGPLGRVIRSGGIFKGKTVNGVIEPQTSNIG
jgi:hypothetical protein